MSLIQISGLKGGYGGEDIVKGIEVNLDKGDFAVIIGPNGAGKSTFLKMVAGLVGYHSGTIQMNGQTLASGDARALSAAGIGFVPQEFNVFASMSVRENLEIGCYAQPRQTKRRIEENEETRVMVRTEVVDVVTIDSAGNVVGVRDTTQRDETDTSSAGATTTPLSDDGTNAG